MSGQYVLADVLRSGLQTYEDVQHRTETAWDVIRCLRAHGMQEAAWLVEQDIDRRECIEAGYCPDCGEALDRLSRLEVHPYGSTVAVEQRTYLYCPVHGEVEA